VSEHTDPLDTTAYEELLTDAVRGVTARFARQDYVEEAWRIVDPVLSAPAVPYEYEPGTWGPRGRYVSPPGGWQDPQVTTGAKTA
jgi:glucose-6-phosphate 1-dehydrogenase